MNADSDLGVSVYINLLEDVPFSCRKPTRSSKNVPTKFGIISAVEVCQTYHPEFTENCTCSKFNMHADNLNTQGPFFGSSMIE